MRKSTQKRVLQTYGFQKLKFKLWDVWVKSLKVKDSSVSISQNDLNLIKTERELLLILDEMIR